jgi:hypothetical protein
MVSIGFAVMVAFMQTPRALDDAGPEAACRRATVSCDYAWASGNGAAAWYCGKNNRLVPKDSERCKELVDVLEREAGWACERPHSVAVMIERILRLEPSKSREGQAQFERARAELKEKGRRCMVCKTIHSPQEGLALTSPLVFLIRDCAE